MNSSFAALLAGLAIASSPARADTFVLQSGGQVDGTLMNATESARTTYVVRSTTGIKVTLKRDQVEEVHKVKPGEAEYAKLRPQFPDTVDGQWKLAVWCQGRGLTELRKRHLERVIELDPEHEKARQILGYAKVDGEWKSRDEMFERHGMVKDEAGRYRMPQQIEERKREKEQEGIRKEWAKKINLWRKWIDTDRSGEALAQLQKIDAPEAVYAIRNQLKDEPVEEVRKTYVDALARIATPAAWQLLTLLSLEDSQEEIRLACLGHVAKQRNTVAVAIYIKQLRSPDNERVNRAGVALARMKDSRAIRPLIDALVTTHTVELPSEDHMSTAFGSSPGGDGDTFAAGDDGPEFIDRQIENQAVRDALVTLTGQDFGYDVQAWFGWLTSQRKTQPSIDVRRD